ncbi:fatty acid synthase-like [Aricia agestis]|uniref:fatty acid synthase-like n=1 Tax=Aricia agestis TaxID=91739 RepID=UPI001C208A93|nr:fatty acid synthase-like [Aricia agestis]
MAFYILFIKSSLRINAPVLIHGGAGALGQALISIALAHGCEVFTTVSNNAKKQFLRKLFPKLKSEYIGNSRDVTFCDMVLDATNGKGCRTVVTCTKGYLKNICFKCCAYTGFVIDTTQIQNREDYKFGLHSLNLERQYVTVDFATLFKPEFVEEVKYLRTMMIKSIQEGIVRPLSRIIFGAHDVSRAFHMQATGLNRGRVLLYLQHLTLNILPRLSFSPSSWQLLFSNNEMFALKTAERLIKQGAKKIVLLLKDPSKCVHIQLRSWSKYGVEVQIINENIWKESSWLTCIQQCKGSPVETVFLITSDEEADNINIIVEKLCTIIHRLCHSLKYFALVNDNAFKNKQITRFSPLQDKIINITIPMNKTINGKEFSNNTLSINNAIDALESAVVQAAHSSDKNILAHIPAEPQNYFLHQLMKIAGIDKESSGKKENLDKTLKDFGIHQTNLLATQRYLCDAYDISWKVEDIEMLTIRTIMELEEEIFGHDFKETSGLGSYFSTVIHDDLLATAEMTFLPTLTTCSSMRDDEFDVTQTYLCIVPGVEGLHSRFEIMCESLKLPALVLQPGLSYPHESVTELASRYAQTLLKKTVLKNKFYLLGYESGVLVALEMAAILEENGLSGTVFCIGGSPTEILADFKHQLIEYKTKEELQVAVLKHLLCSMLTNDNTDELDNILTKNLTWDEKINACLHRLVGKIPHPIQFTKELIKAAYSRLAVMLQYTPVPKQLRSQIISLRPRYLTRVDSSFQDYSSKKMITYQLKAPLSCALLDLMCTAIINRHLDDDILRDFHNRNLCETYLVNATTFMSNDGE